MARAKKPEEKPKEGATLTIDVDSFVRTRDSVRINPFLPAHPLPRPRPRPRPSNTAWYHINDIFRPSRLL